MYRCELCNQPVGEHLSARRVITETRPTSYDIRSGANPRARKRSRDDRGGNGWEIVREVMACAACAKQSPPIPKPPEYTAESAGL